VKQLRHNAMARPDRVLMGAIVGAHGVRGQVRVKSFAAAAKDIASYGPLEDARGRAYTLTVKGGADDIVIASIDGITDRDQAEKLKGTELFVRRDALPAPEDGAFYHADLVGLDVRLKDGTAFGTVRAVHDFGAGDSLEIARTDGDVMVPFTKAAVPVVDIAGGFIVLDPPVGLLEKP
jgi:16S rRNA processing protein RimM